MFFTQINQLMNQGVDITLVIRKKEGVLTVSAMPKSNGLKDEAQNHIVPLTVTGTPQELDMDFMQAICHPLRKVTGLLINMTQFEEQARKAAENSKAAKEQKDKAAKEAKEKKEKFDKLMKKAEELEKEQKLNEALTHLQQAGTIATPQAIKSVNEKINVLKTKLSQGRLFGMETPQRPPQPIQVCASEQPVQQPMNGSPMQPPQPQFYENGQPAYQQPMPRQPQGGQTHYGNQSQNEEPELVMTADYAAHREGEYEEYPDFQVQTMNDNYMYNPSNK